MSNVIPIRPAVAAITPSVVAARQLGDKDTADLGGWVSRKSLQNMQHALESIFCMIEEARSLPDDVQDKIVDLGGLDYEAVFDHVFEAHFGLSTAEELLKLLQRSAKAP